MVDTGMIAKSKLQDIWHWEVGKIGMEKYRTPQTETVGHGEHLWWIISNSLELWDTICDRQTDGQTDMLPLALCTWSQCGEHLWWFISPKKNAIFGGGGHNDALEKVVCNQGQFRCLFYLPNRTLLPPTSHTFQVRQLSKFP